MTERLERFDGDYEDVVLSEDAFLTVMEYLDRTEMEYQEERLWERLDRRWKAITTKRMKPSK